MEGTSKEYGNRCRRLIDSYNLIYVGGKQVPSDITTRRFFDNEKRKEIR